MNVDPYLSPPGKVEPEGPQFFEIPSDDRDHTCPNCGHPGYFVMTTPYENVFAINYDGALSECINCGANLVPEKGNHA